MFSQAFLTSFIPETLQSAVMKRVIIENVALNSTTHLPIQMDMELLILINTFDPKN